MPRRKPEIKLPPHRPKLPISWEEVDQLLMSGLTGTEIAGFLGVCVDTLYDRCILEKRVPFSVYSLEKRKRGDGMIKAKQFSEAMKGDRTMLVWLGKNRLGQKENPQTQEEFNGSLAGLLQDLLEKGKANTNTQEEEVQ